MNRDIIELREVIQKLVPLLSGKGLVVTQRGSKAYVKTDPRTKRPVSVNIPNIGDNATPDFIRAIQGYIDHEVGHVLFTDWNLYGRGPSVEELQKPEVRRFIGTHNMVEDTMIEKEMVKIFPGSERNLGEVRRYFLEKITTPALAKAKDDKEKFQYLLVPLLRALAGHGEFKEFFDKNGYWKNPYVEGLMKAFSKRALDLLKSATTTKETLEVAEELHLILHPPKPPAPPAPPPPAPTPTPPPSTPPAPSADPEEDEPEEDEPEEDEDEKDEEPEKDKDESEPAPKSKPEPEEDDESEEDTGESEDLPEKKAGEGDGDGDRDHDDDWDDDDEDDADGGEDDTGPKSASDDDFGDVSGGSDGDDEPEEESDDIRGSGSAAGGGDEDEDEDESEDEAGASSGSSGDGDEEDRDEKSKAKDKDEAEDEKDKDAEAEGHESEPEQVVDEEGKDGGSVGDIDEGDEHETGDDADGGGVGNDAGKSMFDYAEDAFDKADMGAQIEHLICEGAVEAMDASQYNVFTRELDRIEPLVPPENINAKWVPDMEEEVRVMTGRMQKDIDRMMASQSYVIRTPGHKSGKLHAPSLFRVSQGDPRVFSQRQEHISKDTAVTLLCDNSGSMSGQKMRLCMLSAYALLTTLDRVNITHEVIGFTTGDYSAVPRSIQDAMWEEARGSGVDYDRIEPIIMPIYKDFKERVTATVKKRIAYAMNAQKGLVGNIDGESLEYAAERLVKRTEKRKVMLVLSDGQPAGSRRSGPHLSRVVKDLTKVGIECIGIGIMDNSVRRYYPNSVVITRAEELPGEVMTALKKILA